LVTFVYLFLSISAFAQSGDPNKNAMLAFTGNEFFDLCDATSNNVSIQQNLSSCRLFLNGFIQGMFVAKWNHVGSEAKALKCSPNIDNVTNQQVLDVVLKFLRENPSVRDASIGLLVYEAINEAWPNLCTQQVSNPDSTSRKNDKRAGNAR
jgi:hypothetical protein